MKMTVYLGYFYINFGQKYREKKFIFRRILDLGLNNEIQTGSKSFSEF